MITVARSPRIQGSHARTEGISWKGDGCAAAVTRSHLSLRAERCDRRTVVAASGEIDTATDLEAVIDGELADGQVDVLVIDLVEVSFVDSPGLQCWWRPTR